MIFVLFQIDLYVVYEQSSTLLNHAKRAMVCTSNDLLEWKDFPKGLRVLLLDENTDSANEMKAKLEEMEYIVSAFSSETEALSAISSKTDSFHVAILEVNVHNSEGRYKFLGFSKDLPTIMTSNEHCLSTMMKCIALGAVEFLIQPLPMEKLRNIWQHVVHKPFNTTGSEASESLKLIEDFAGSVMEVRYPSIVSHDQVQEEPKLDFLIMNQNEHDLLAISDKFSAPSTPQLKQGERFLDDGDYQEQPNSSPVKENVELDRDVTKSVDTTNRESVADPPQATAELAIKEEDYCGEGSKGTKSTYPESLDEEGATDLGSNNWNSDKDSARNLCGTKGNRKKVKVDWTPDLHKRFVQAVEKLGVNQAIPSKVLELMKVESLTRHNVASHLQKYRMHRRHSLPKEDNRRWPQPHPRTYYPHRPVLAFPPYQTNHSLAQGHAFPMWGPRRGRPPGFPMWRPPTYPNWQPMENWQWNRPYPGLHADAWGCPVLIPPPPTPSSTFPQLQISHEFQRPDHYGKNFADLQPGEEVIDKVMKEAISKPWLPLPIGLKPPSTDSVLAELSQQGISAVPPQTVTQPGPQPQGK